MLAEPIIRQVADSAELATLVSVWETRPWLALDTEFFRETTFWAQPGLVQVGDGTCCYLVEPAAAAGCPAFSALLANPAIIKLMHSPSEDIDLFRSWLGCELAGIYDTQIAAAMAGLGFSMGYAACIAKVLGVTIDKEQTRSNWLLRPLTPEQVMYAALDVHYLPLVYEHFELLLQPRGLAGAVIEEGTTADPETPYAASPGTYYLSVKGAWKLNERQQQILANLCEWRETECRTRNRARSHVAKDVILMELARLKPATMAALAATQLLPPPALRRYGEQIVELLHREDSCYRGPIEPPFSGRALSVFKAIRQEAEAEATRLNLPSEFFARRRLLEPTASWLIGQREDFPMAWLGWRRRLSGDLFGRWVREYRGDEAANSYLSEYPLSRE